MLNNSPYVRSAEASVQRVMAKVLIALLPGLAAYVWQFGIAILIQLLLATVTALVCEALMLKARGKPLGLFLSDFSVVVTAWLIALAFPAIVPWWITVSATAFAVIIAKQMYGGLGQNPFNPAMVAYAVMIVAFPALMSQWPASGLSPEQQLGLIFGGGERVLDAVTSATPLDALRTGLRASGATVSSVVSGPAFGWMGGRHWEWVIAGYALGGLWLLRHRVISWHIPAAFIGGVLVFSGVFWLWDGAHFASPLLQVASGATMLGAFFILTDPVSAASTPRGKLIYAAGAALVTVLVRLFGAYPDGVAFATLLMNLCVPLIDMKTQPPVFGHKK